MQFHAAAGGFRLMPGDRVPVTRFATALGLVVDVTRRRLPTHVQFRSSSRDDPDLGSFIRRRAELERAAHVLLLFREPEEELLLLAGALPFEMVADPGQLLFDAFGVRIHASERSSMPGPVDGVDPRCAEFLVRSDGRIEASRTASDAAGPWTVDDVLALAAWAIPRSAG